MNKSEFIDYIASKNSIKKFEAEKLINMFTDAVAGTIAEGKELTLVGFGSFSISKIAAKEGRNPKTGEPLKIKSYNQVRFKVGQKLKSACNSDKQAKQQKDTKQNTKSQSKAKK